MIAAVLYDFLLAGATNQLVCIDFTVHRPVATSGGLDCLRVIPLIRAVYRIIKDFITFYNPSYLIFLI